MIDASTRFLLSKLVNFRMSAPEFPEEGPFSTFTINERVDIYSYTKLGAMSFFISRASRNLRKRILSWVQGQIPEIEETDLPLLWTTLLRYYKAEGGSLSSLVLSGIKAAYARVASNASVLAKCVEASLEVLGSGGDKNRKGPTNGFKATGLESILGVLDKATEHLIAAPEPSGRRAAAMFISMCSEMGWMNEERTVWLERLRSDARARVCRVFGTRT